MQLLEFNKKKKNTKKWTLVPHDNWNLDENRWSIHKKYYGSNLTSFYYYCKGRSSLKCQAEIRVDFGDKGLIEGLAKSFNHSIDCENAYEQRNSKPSVFLNLDIKQKIEKIIEKSYKRPRDIKDMLKQQFDLEVDSKFIYNFISRKKTVIKNLNLNISANSLEAMCLNFGYKNDSSPFVLSYSTDPLRVFISCFSSLVNFSKVTNIHIDSTYKSNIYGFPIIVLGFTDLSRKFFCSGLILSSNEDTDTFVWIFQSIKNYLNKRGLQFAVTNVIADSAKQITSAVNLFDQNLLRTNCWAHVSREIKKSILKVKDIELQTYIYTEIQFLQALTNRLLFERGMVLFINKYMQFNQTRSFINDFSNKHIKTNSNWIESYDIFSPSTNNALERFNLYIKDRFIKWNKIGLNEFFETANQILSKSIEDIPILEKIHYDIEDAKPENYSFNFVTHENGFDVYLLSDGSNTEIQTKFIFFIQNLTFLMILKNFILKQFSFTVKIL